MKLVRPSIKYADIFSEALEEGPIVHMALTDKDSISKTDFDREPDQYFKILNDIENLSVTTPKGQAYEFDYHELFWLISDEENQFIGCCSLRDSQNPITQDFLKNSVGHFGQSIRKSMRSKGYGSAQWELVKEYARNKGFKVIYRGANPDNIASLKGIQKTGGVLAVTSPDLTGWGETEMYRFDL